MYSSAFGWKVLKISIRSIWSNVSFKTFVSLLIPYFDDLSTGESGVLKSPAIIVLLSISPLMPLVFALCIEVLLCWVHRHLRLLCLLLGLIPWSLYSVLLCLIFFILKSILYEIRIATPAFFWFPFSWNIFSHPFTFSLFVSLGLKWVSYRHHIYGSCLCTHSTVYIFWLVHLIHLYLR